MILLTDYKELLKDKDIEVVHVLTPNRSHADITVDSLHAGKHVMCEKPMAKTAADAKRILDYAHKLEGIEGWVPKVVTHEEKWLSLNKSNFSLMFNSIKEQMEERNLMDFYSVSNVAILKRQYRMNEDIFSLVKEIYSIHDGFELIDEKRYGGKDVLSLQIDGEEIIDNDYTFSFGRYCAMKIDDDGEPIQDKILRISSEISAMFEESNRLEALIKENLEKLSNAN